MLLSTPWPCRSKNSKKFVFVGTDGTPTAWNTCTWASASCRSCRWPTCFPLGFEELATRLLWRQPLRIQPSEVFTFVGEKGKNGSRISILKQLDWLVFVLLFCSFFLHFFPLDLVSGNETLGGDSSVR